MIFSLFRYRVKVPFTNGNIHIRNSGMYTQISSLRGVLTMTFHLQHGINVSTIT